MANPGNILPPLATGVTGPNNIPLIAATSAPNLNLAMTSNPATPQHSPMVGHQQPRPARPPPPPLDTMRAYRACLNCRNRKSKCDLDINGGRPPCRRCQREAKDCVLGDSHRGGRRVRKKPKLDDDGAKKTDKPTNLGFQGASSSNPATPSTIGFPQPTGPSPRYNTVSAPQTPQQPQAAQSFQNPYTGRTEPSQPFVWPPQQPTPAPTAPSDSSRHIELDHTLGSPPIDPALSRPRQESIVSVLGKNGERTAVHENIASADLQNPSDALDILAQVADRADDESSPPSDHNHGHPRQQQTRSAARRQDPSPVKLDDTYFHYKPVQDNMISPEMIYHLFSNYEEFFHPFFPIIPQATFDRTRLPWMSRHEPHLFSAILTVASKDNERVHQICYDHNQQLISMILAGADANVEAVEGLLLLSQWVSHRPQASIAVGRGEEDRVAWMFIGTALRLGYYLGIDRTSFKSECHEDPAVFNRKRLVWAACYICDRQVSVRLGKGFWARGPGPLSGLKSSDFPTLQPTTPGADDWSLIFQANLELTQIFSNVHDILYSSKGHGWKEMLEGRYAKFLDDFRASIRNWNDAWGDLRCSTKLKASLGLTYDYLRLYVNAFAYQATISRALTFQRDSQHTPNRPMPLINASAPDARFIYEALDAAQSLLNTFNDYIDLETLRYMPSSYYLFIIYGAVFLYKARSTTTMTEEERNSVRLLILRTIERLQKASVDNNHMGSRYARLLQMLWRKAPKRPREPQHNPGGIDGRLNAPNSQVPSNIPQSQFDPSGQYPQLQMSNMNMNGQFQQSRPSNAFSWLDLGATWNFATQNNQSGSDGEADGSMVLENGPSPFDMGDIGILTDYSLLEGDNPNLVF